jgi:formylglycine-generating enzyme required for sulfatase activity
MLFASRASAMETNRRLPILSCLFAILGGCNGRGSVASDDVGVDTLPADLGSVASDERPGAAPPGNWIQVKNGTFVMGSPDDEPCRALNEAQQQVTLTHDLEVQTTEVTWQQFKDVMGYTLMSTDECGPDCPVNNVTWSEAAAYCNALSRLSGRAECYGCTDPGSAPALISCREPFGYDGDLYTCDGYRLPTAAESEYLARAGTNSAYPGGANDPLACECDPLDVNLDPVAWYCGNSSGARHPVGKKLANAWGIHDLLGNVAEWCNDGYETASPEVPVQDPTGPMGASLRGGSYASKARDVRPARHAVWLASSRSDEVGFRCIRVLPK